MTTRDQQYIGDGVYISHDGYQLWLRVNGHNTMPLVALEQSVFIDMIRYSAVLWDNEQLANVLRSIADEIED